MTSIPIAGWQTSAQSPPKRTAHGGSIPLSKDAQLRPAEAMFRTWHVELPRWYSLNDVLEPPLWRSTELQLRERGEKHCPRVNDLIRVVAVDGDAFFKIDAINGGYRLSFYCGQMPTREAS
jgi:hypothetical protein